MDDTIKLIDQNTDLSKVLHPLGWDINMNGVSYRGYFVYEEVNGQTIYYNHTLGGRTDYVWACPRNEEPSYDNLLQFNGQPCRWGIKTFEKNYFKSKWGESSMEKTCVTQILRNDEVFDEFGSRDMFYGIAKAQYLIEGYKEHPLGFNDYGFEQAMVGRKIRYRGVPAVIERWVPGQACVMIKPRNPEDIDKFFSDPTGSRDKYLEGFYEECKADGNLKADINSSWLWWWE